MPVESKTSKFKETTRRFLDHSPSHFLVSANITLNDEKAHIRSARPASRLLKMKAGRIFNTSGLLSYCETMKRLLLLGRFRLFGGGAIWRGGRLSFRLLLGLRGSCGHHNGCFFRFPWRIDCHFFPFAGETEQCHCCGNQVDFHGIFWIGLTMPKEFSRAQRLNEVQLYSGPKFS